jgi:hypothetical protein
MQRGDLAIRPRLAAAHLGISRYPNQQLGANAPSPLPTSGVWVRKFGFAVTYSIPIP